MYSKCDQRTTKRVYTGFWLEYHPESLHERFNKEFVLECAIFIFTKQ